MWGKYGDVGACIVTLSAELNTSKYIEKLPAGLLQSASDDQDVLQMVFAPGGHKILLA
jgi:hypothetical protein